MLRICVSAQIADEKCDMVTYIGEAPYFDGDITNYIQSKINYPNSALKDSIDGIVFISFWLDTLGASFDHKIVRGIRDDLNLEALRVAKMIKFNEPAKQRERPIKVKYVIPVDFKLPKEED